MERKTESQQKDFVRRPNRQIRLRTSNDGKYFMVDIVETWFFPVNYVATIAANAGKPKPRPASDKPSRKASKVEA